MSRWGNQFKTFILLALLTALMLWAGEAFGGRQGLYIALVIVLLMNFFTYWFSDKLVLRMYRAQPVTKKQAPELYTLVKEVASAAKIPMPKVYIIPTDSPNAFATGRNPEHAAVACTQGIINLLNKDELKGVIAHEVSHIKNRDTLIQVVAATIAGVISYLAFFARFAAIFGGGGRDRDSRGLELLALAILTPLIATIIQLAISRSREYLADASAAKTLHNSDGLASALHKLETGIKQHPLRFGSAQTSNIFIANPFSGGGMLALFSTHPPMQERIKKLKGMEL
ncbi:zinc metalloprotease HtpX [Candidatus Woesearchaeota archaeon]|nr:zinc metalloprotease HtpX [Candidatus Woesearchaeota archaeon]